MYDGTNGFSRCSNLEPVKYCLYNKLPILKIKK